MFWVWWIFGHLSAKSFGEAGWRVLGHKEDLQENIVKGSESLIMTTLIMKLLVPVVTGCIDVEPIKC